MKYSISFIIIILVSTACTYYEHNFAYDFDQPSLHVDLNKELDEISGLAYRSKTQLAAVQDEKGTIYLLDAMSGKIQEEIKFEGSGDFEGIAIAHNSYYVLKSDGDIYEVDGSGEYKKYPFKAEEKSEFEGLCYNSRTNSLLLACKEHHDKDENDHLWIYEFDLNTYQFKQKPYLKIDKALIHKSFGASGIALNEKGHLIVISGKSYSIAEISTEGDIINQTQLSPIAFSQIEGVCLSPTGDLYLSDEKSDQDRANIIKLNRNAP